MSTSHDTVSLPSSLVSPYSITTRMKTTSESMLPLKSEGESSRPAVTYKSARNSAIAGYSAGLVSVVFGHPLDSLKVWAQTSSSGKNKHFMGSTGNGSAAPSALASTGAQYTGVSSRQATRTMSTLASQAISEVTPRTSSSTIQSHKVARTVRALYSGASVPLFTVGIIQSINFVTYDGLRRVLHRADVSNGSSGDYLHNDSLWNVAAAGFMTGTSLALITSPLIMIKTSQQVTGNGFREAVRQTLFPHGRLNISGCFAGFHPHLASETIGRAVYYSAYEACKRHISASRQEQGLSSSITVTERMAAAATAGVVCWTAIYPLDVLRNRMYSQVGRAAGSPTLSTWEMAQAVYRERALYRGFSVTVLRAGPVAAMVLPVYDLALDYLSSSDL